MSDRISKARRVLGLRVFEARTALGLSQRDVARRLGLRSPVSVGEWERGRSFPKFEVFLRLCEALKRPPAFFLEDYDALPEPLRELDAAAAVERVEQRLQQRHLELLHRFEQLPAEISRCLPPDEIVGYLDRMDFEADVLPALPLDIRGALRARKMSPALEETAFSIARNAAWHAWDKTRESVRAWVRGHRRT
jgi:transcriptional regulator with XRE-family HTH domain